MNEKCAIPAAIEAIKSGCFCQVAFLGGSITVGSGASNTAVTTWRRLFMRYLYETVVPLYHVRTGEVMAAIGAMSSMGAVFTINRNVIPKKPRLVFVEECVNDSGFQNRDDVKKAVEGIIRQLKAENMDVVFLGAAADSIDEDGVKKDRIHQEPHREVAGYYDVPFIDIQSYVNNVLEERGQTWADVTITQNVLNSLGSTGDSIHLNDYGNRLWFECMKEWFEKQLHLFDEKPVYEHPGELKPVLFSDEFQFTKLINACKKSKSIKLEGDWHIGDEVPLPWHLDDVLVGRPGAVLTFTFTGRAVGAFNWLHCNGLKLEAKLDGEELAGPFTNFAVDFAMFHMFRHGMDYGEHVLELTVGKPLKRLNNLENPTARIGFLAVAGHQ